MLNQVMFLELLHCFVENNIKHNTINYTIYNKYTLVYKLICCFLYIIKMKYKFITP